MLLTSSNALPGINAASGGGCVMGVSLAALYWSSSASIAHVGTIVASIQVYGKVATWYVISAYGSYNGVLVELLASGLFSIMSIYLGIVGIISGIGETGLS